MYRKRIVFLIIMALILTGCTKIDNNIDNVISATLSKEIKDVNTVSTGYELYIPIGARQLVDNEYNQKFEIRDTYVYLYVDTISYYHKNNLNYKNTDSYNYYYKEVSFNNKVGYIGVNKVDDDSYFVQIVYNYAKIEFYANERDLPFLISNSLIIINGIKYNDNLIKVELEKITNENREIKYELDKPDDSKSTFNQYLQEFVEEEESEVILPDME